MREGQPVPEHLLPQVLDMKAIKKEMAYLVSLAREAAAAAGLNKAKAKGLDKAKSDQRVRTLIFQLR